MHALLFRKWGKHVKERDWCDLEWYIKNGFSLNLRHFVKRAIDSKDWSKEDISKKSELTDLLRRRIEEVNLLYAKEDVQRFIKNPERIDIWSADYFHDLVKHLKVTYK